MRNLTFSAVLLATATSLVAQSHIVSISPATGPVSGGTRVTIKLSDIPPCPILPPGPGVMFGKLPAAALDFGPENTIIATAPAHPAGTVDVSVTICPISVTASRSFTYVDPAQAPNAGDYEKVLFPVVYEGAGANGSLWGTRIAAYNSSEQTLSTPRPIFEGDPQCPAICGCSMRSDITPGQTEYVCVTGFEGPMGLIFYAPRILSSRIHFTSRVFDFSRSAHNGGTEIPVARERDFRDDLIALADIPLDPLYRISLRVFNPEQWDGAQVRMTVIDPANGASIGEQVITLSYPIRNVVYDPFPIRPAFAFIGDLENVVRSMLPAGSSLKSFHLRLTPVTPGIRLWAMASLTNNDTQVVTTITPQ